MASSNYGLVIGFFDMYITCVLGADRLGADNRWLPTLPMASVVGMIATPSCPTSGVHSNWTRYSTPGARIAPLTSRSRRDACKKEQQAKAENTCMAEFRWGEVRGAVVHTWKAGNYRLRVAARGDEPALRELIARSIRELGANDYRPEQIEAALTGAFGIDSSLIRDGTYFVVVSESGEIVGCGGWSKRRTLFGSDARADRDDTWLDPRSDPAKVRAFFIHPDHVRRGLGRLILERSEAEAIRAGFAEFELMATLPGKRLYERCGYVPGSPIQHPLPGGILITFVPMRKQAA